VIVLGKMLRDYARAHAAYQADAEHCPPAVKRWVMQITAASVMEQSRGGD